MAHINHTIKSFACRFARPCARAWQVFYGSTVFYFKRGNQIIKKTKTTTYYIEHADIINSRDTLEFIKEEDIKEVKSSEIPIMDTSSTGSNIKEKYDYIIKKAELEEVKEEAEEDIDLPMLNKENPSDDNEDFLAGFRL